MIPGVPADLDVTESHWAIALPPGLDPDCPAAVGNNQTIADSGVPESSCLEGLFRLVLLGRIHNRVTFGDKGKSARRLRQQEQHGKDLPEFNPFEHAYEVILRLMKCGVQQVTRGRPELPGIPRAPQSQILLHHLAPISRTVRFSWPDAEAIRHAFVGEK
jgi:hypothetical protein